MKRGKKGQLTLYIIIAILVISIFMIGFSLYKSYKERTKKVLQSEIEKIKLFVHDCFDIASNNILEIIRWQSGYYKKSELSKDGIAYYFIGTNKYTPKPEEVKEEISNGIEKEFFYCLNNFSDFESNIKIRELVINTAIKEKIKIRLNLSLKIAKGKEKSLLEIKKQKIEEVDLEKIIEAANLIAEEFIKEKQFLPFVSEKLEDEINKRELNLTIEEYGGDLLFVLKENDFEFLFLGSPYLI